MLYLINDINDQLINSMVGTNNVRNCIPFKSIIYIYLLLIQCVLFKMIDSSQNRLN